MSSFVTEESIEVQRKIKSLLPGRASFSIDPGEIYARMGEAVHPLIDGAEVLFTSEKEIGLLFGGGFKAAVQRALKLAKIVIVKRGSKGASLYLNGASFDAAIEQVNVVDNTGAGDVLNGVFLGLYMKGIEPAVALSVATRAASMSTTGYGRDAYPHRREVEAIYAAVKKKEQ
jgi:ribokinase